MYGCMHDSLNDCGGNIHTKYSLIGRLWRSHVGYSPWGRKESDTTERLHFHGVRKCSAAAAKSLQSCPTLCDPIDGSTLGTPVPGILQARTLEWVTICFSNAWKWKVKVKSLSRVWLLTTPWTVAYQHPLSMGFSRQEYWSGLPLPSPRKCSSFILLQVIDQFSQHHLLKRLSFIHCILLPPLSKIRCP